MESFGEIIRDARNKRKLILRQVSALVDIDQGIISKIERGERKPSRKQVIRFAEVFELDLEQLIIHWLSDKIVEELKEEKNGNEILTMVKSKLTVLKNK